MNTIRTKSTGPRKITAAAVVAIAALAAGCATTGELPIAQITKAETAIKESIETGARTSAPIELNAAEKHLAMARKASAKKDYETARRLAERAEADAELAEAKATLAESQATLAEIRKGIRILREELDRKFDQSS